MNTIKSKKLLDSLKLNLGFGGFYIILSIINLIRWSNIKNINEMYGFANGNLKFAILSIFISGLFLLNFLKDYIIYIKENK